MKDLLLTADGDLFISSAGDIQLTDSVRQAILIRLQWFFGEWRFRPDFGVPYFEDILIKNPNGNLVRQLILEQILDVEEVWAVPKLELSMDKRERKLRVVFTALTTQGKIQEEVTLDAEIRGNG